MTKKQNLFIIKRGFLSSLFVIIQSRAIMAVWTMKACIQKDTRHDCYSEWSSE